MLRQIHVVAIAAGTIVWASACYAQTFAYVTNIRTNVVSAYTVDVTTGALSPVPGSPFPTGTAPYGGAITPSQKFLYIADNACPNLICTAPSTISGYTINPITGTLTPVPSSPFPAGMGPHSIAIVPSGQFLYVTNAKSSNISGYSINPGTGELTQIAGSPFSAGMTTQGIVVDPSGRFLYGDELSREQCIRVFDKWFNWSADSGCRVALPSGFIPFSTGFEPLWALPVRAKR
jgi:6-phosphogluconolactonase (cycloisomerase 2 family)